MANKILATASKISLGVVIVLVLLWFYIKANLLFPANTGLWKEKILTYMLMATFVFGWNSLNQKTEKALFKTSFLKRFPVFIVAFILTLIILFTFGIILKGGSLPSIKEALSNVSVGVLLFHALVVAFIEQLVFFGWLKGELISSGIKKSLAVVMVIGTFAFFHYALNGEWLTLLLYVPLGYIFNYVAEKYSPQSHLADSGAHFGYNVFAMFLS